MALYLHGRESTLLLLAIPLEEACWPVKMQRTNAYEIQNGCQSTGYSRLAESVDS